MSQFEKVSSSRFYGEYHGHRVQDLEIILRKLRNQSDSIIWTAGDSSLDNKYWFSDTQDAIGAYHDVLEPPHSVCDVTYWLNHFCEKETRSASRLAAINTAVEATTLNERTYCLRAQDCFLRDNIREDDILVVSVGGNDIAMAPAPCTIASMFGLLSFPMYCIEQTISCGVVPVDDCCCGCGPSLLSCGCTFPPCAGYFRHLWGVRVESYIRKLISKTKPKKVLVCMIYYPDENNVPSWANAALGALSYNRNPAKLQAMIRSTFKWATSKIKIPGTEIIPVPLYHVLDGKLSRDFVARVEPSSEGGKKMAEYILDIIHTPPGIGEGTNAPTPSYMETRN
mmetsp:Transcript_32059/g.48416  ORF Transcript_32059/g.48416 Transcript_32059/m.48416 type:complete len:339 (-) Transcript_32059:97-1113(-)|eukprot:CAMPEP_0178916882 /NCGR_PEP_ID=MMETSP0786-20121207/12913_1 /TAXON_ID=186022 /ORGANISM="Thalassionema frauenfeldii, Strain CCMP 1798" /LENGTH=338 /DNA_ID=CAMNT_0020590321 /DNA_START=45 /DNA_END=1061 /DNA_ORIENTATION=-